MSPSGMCLTNTVDWYKFTGVLDAEGSILPTSYPPAPTLSGLSCSVQLIEAEKEVRQANRIGTYFYGWVEFSTFYPFLIRDKLVWATPLVTHNLMVLGITDGAGRGVVFGVQVEERV